MDPYSNTYNPGWRNHPNLRYGPTSPNYSGGQKQNNQGPTGQMQQPQHQPQQQQQPYRHPNHQGGGQPNQNTQGYQNRGNQPPQNFQPNAPAQYQSQNQNAMQALIQYQMTNDARMAKVESSLERLTEMATKQENTNQQMHAAMRAMETSISQISKELGQRNPGKLPSNSVENPKGTEHCNAVFVIEYDEKSAGMTLRGGKKLDVRKAPEEVEQDDEQGTERVSYESPVEGTEVKEKGKQETSSDQKNQPPLKKKKWQIAKEKRELAEKEAEKGYRPPLPFPQRFFKKKEDDGYLKFVDILKKIHINIPFIDAISKIPSYAKFLKEILTKKKRIDDVDSVILSGECNAILQGELPNKRTDEGLFSVPCKIGKASALNALCDLGASINLMPYSVFKRLGLQEVTPTKMALKFADKSTKTPRGIAENILIKIGKLIYPVDFVILDMVEDCEMPLILGRPFLYTARANIDLANKKLTLFLGEENVRFNMAQHSEQIPSESEHQEMKECHEIDVKNVTIKRRECEGLNVRIGKETKKSVEEENSRLGRLERDEKVEEIAEKGRNKDVAADILNRDKKKPKKSKELIQIKNRDLDLFPEVG